MATTEAQRELLVILPKISGVISVLGSSIVALSILRDPKKLAKSYHRLLLGMSLADATVSFFMALSSWPMPASSDDPFAAGTIATCNMQGFFIQTLIIPCLYSGSLAFYYTVVLRYGWSEARVRKVEPYLHSVPLMWGLGTAIIGIPLKLYNPAVLWCWMAPYPVGCTGEDCIRGGQADTFRWAFTYVPLWINIIGVTIAMSLVWLTVREGSLSCTNSNAAASPAALTSLGNKTTKTVHADGSSEEEDKVACLLQDEQRVAERERLAQKIKQSVAFQGFLYSGSFYVTWIWLTTVRVLQTVDRDVPFELLATAAFLSPFQGFFNMIIYLSPRFTAVKKANPNAGVVSWLRDALWG